MAYTIRANKRSLIIGVVGIHTLINLSLYDALILMGQNLKNIYYTKDNKHFDHTIPIAYKFWKPGVIFWRNQTSHSIQSLQSLLQHSDGLIINLGGRVLDIDYLDGNIAPQFASVQLKKLVTIISELNKPIVFTLEDPSDSFEPIEYFFNRTPIEGGGESWQSIFKLPGIESQKINIWQPSSLTIQSIRKTLNIADNVPVLPYSYRKPISIQNILTTLLQEIENQSESS